MAQNHDRKCILIEVGRTRWRGKIVTALRLSEESSYFAERGINSIIDIEIIWREKRGMRRDCLWLT